MKPAEQVQEWLHYYTFLLTDEAKWSLFMQLKRERKLGSAVANEALTKLIAKWMDEK